MPRNIHTPYHAAFVWNCCKSQGWSMVRRLSGVESSLALGSFLVLAQIVAFSSPFPMAPWRMQALPDDPKSKLFTLHGEVWTTGWFKEFVKVGQAVPVDQVVSQTFQILGDHNVPFIIYSSSVSKPSQFVDDPEVTKVSEFLVRARDFPGCALSGVEVRMYFGRALIEVEFYDKSTGTRVHRRVLAKLAP
eukprot:m.132093 g.132093  ORF g.132093 m.132093 type:complete len:190 (+) comp52374_c0_seq6:2941-3510(+)